MSNPENIKIYTHYDMYAPDDEIHVMLPIWFGKCTDEKMINLIKLCIINEEKQNIHYCRTANE